MKRYAALLWLLSGVPVGIALAVLPWQVRLWLFTIFIALDLAHTFSPITLAWSTSTRRSVILTEPCKYILGPVIILLAACLIGAATSAGLTSYQPGPGAFAKITDLTNPFPLLVWFYSSWNIYHFAMQDFGVLMICTSRRYRLWKMLTCLTILPAVYFATQGLSLWGRWELPPLIAAWWIAPMIYGIMSVNHWIVDIGLSLRVAPNRVAFAAYIMAFGLLGFLWSVPTPIGTKIRVIPWLIGARLGLGFVHFLYSRWVWKLSDPQVRTTIGQDLFRRCEGRPPEVNYGAAR